MAEALTLRPTRRSLFRAGVVVTGCLLLFITGCSSDPGPDGNEEPPQAAEVNSDDIDDSGEAPAENRSGPMSLDEELDLIVRGHDLTDLPDVSTVRTVTPEEREVLFAECMAERGFPQQEDSGYHFEGASQAEPFGLAIYECTVMYPVDDQYRQPLTNAQIALVHEHTLETMIPCYEDNGWPIDTDGVPSRETYIATWDTSEQWIPDPPPEDMESDEVSRIEGTCSWSPPSEELYAPELLEGG